MNPFTFSGRALASRRPVEQYGGTGRRLERREPRQPFAEPGSAGRERKAAEDVNWIAIPLAGVTVLSTLAGGVGRAAAGT